MIATAALQTAPSTGYDIPRLHSKWAATRRLLERSGCDDQVVDVRALLATCHQVCAAPGQNKS